MPRGLLGDLLVLRWAGNVRLALAAAWVLVLGACGSAEDPVNPYAGLPPIDPGSPACDGGPDVCLLRFGTIPHAGTPSAP